MTKYTPLGSKANAKPELVFVGPDSGGINVVTTAASNTLKVRVNRPFRIVHEGRVHTGDDVLEVPDDETTRFWRTARWVELVPASQKGKA
jgi:hypothetical protein